jgi:hypothetical protein
VESALFLVLEDFLAVVEESEAAVLSSAVAVDFFFFLGFGVVSL